MGLYDELRVEFEGAEHSVAKKGAELIFALRKSTLPPFSQLRTALERMQKAVQVQVDEAGR